MKEFWFLQVQPAAWWPVADPVAWCLENAVQPLLTPARDRLLTFDAHSDPERIINVVLRRCGLNLVEIASPEQVSVHYWTAVADPRRLFKQQQLARPEVHVAHLRHKTGAIVLQQGNSFLYGERVWPGFRLGVYQRKWDRRDHDEADDWTGATRSTYSWPGMSERWIPWSVLKRIWRREQAPPCPNCDVPLVLVAFRLSRHLLSANDSYLDWLCFWCRRMFEDWCCGSLWPWLVQHLEPALLPAWHHGIISSDLRPLHAVDQLQRAKQLELSWKRIDKQNWQP